MGCAGLLVTVLSAIISSVAAMDDGDAVPGLYDVFCRCGDDPRLMSKLHPQSVAYDSRSSV